VAAACVFGAVTESLMSPLTRASQPGAKAATKGREDAAALVERVVAFCFHGLGRPVPRPPRARAKTAVKKRAHRTRSP